MTPDVAFSRMIHDWIYANKSALSLPSWDPIMLISISQTQGTAAWVIGTFGALLKHLGADYRDLVFPAFWGCRQRGLVVGMGGVGRGGGAAEGGRPTSPGWGTPNSQQFFCVPPGTSVWSITHLSISVFTPLGYFVIIPRFISFLTLPARTKPSPTPISTS